MRRGIARSGQRHRVMLCVIAGFGAIMHAMPQSLDAQERLIGSRSIGAASSFERITFGGGGLVQSGFAGLDSTRVLSAQQFTLPVTASSPLGNGWRLDVTTLFASGNVTFTDSVSGNTRSASLTGMSDVRARATGRLLRDAVLLTVGVNAPTGRTSLTGSQFSALRVLSAPSLGMGSSPVGAGLSGTVGLVVAQQLGDWALAYGTSYELRGSYQPVAALTAGSESADFLPGGVFRASLGADRLIGAHRLSLGAAADVFADDRLRGVPVSDSLGTSPGDDTGEARVRLGPVLSGDAQLLIATSRLRELVTYAAYRWRAPFARDGRTVERSSGQYVEAGIRAVVPWGRMRDLILSTDARWHSGLGVDQGLPTAGVTSASASAAVQFTRGLLSVQPFARAQLGQLRQRAAIVPTDGQSFLGIGGGLVIVSRF